MEGVGSRPGRVSSRSGSVATSSVFSGPVRKWKKKWVNVSPSPAVVSHSRSNGHRRSNGNGSDNVSSSHLVLCRWTPLPLATAATDDAATAGEEEPARRRFRYTPVSVIEEQSTSVKNDEDEAKTSVISQVKNSPTSKGNELNADNDLKKEAKYSEIGHLDLGLCLKGHIGSSGFAGQSKDTRVKSASSGGFWTMA